MSHTVMMASKILQDIDRIDFVRIDGDRNDLPWHYTIDKFPALLVFPENRSVDSIGFYEEFYFNFFLIAGKRKVEFSQRIFKLTFKMYWDLC